jgi:hypothetical protein
VVSAADPHCRNLGFLDRSRYFPSSRSSIVHTRPSGPRSRPTALPSTLCALAVWFCLRLIVTALSVTRLHYGSVGIACSSPLNIFIHVIPEDGPLLWSSGQSSRLQIRKPGFDSRHYQKKKVVGLVRGPLSLVSTTEKLLDRIVAAPV